VGGKIANQRTLLRRNHADPPAMALDDLSQAAETAAHAESLATLLGVEGNAARVYFSQLPGMLKPRQGDDPASCGFTFDFAGRNRRPPTDPVNALLSLGYAILGKDLTVACWVVGFDPFLGFFHQPKYGKPALALDLMEEFRAIIVDSVVITAINTGVVDLGDFLCRGSAVALRPEGRRRFLQAYERRLSSLVTHPVFGYRICYRRVLEVQARILARVLLGELPAYVPFTTR
jgi:CRISPR-associated protein Cas1